MGFCLCHGPMDAADVVDLLDTLLTSDLCEDLEYQLASHPEKLTKNERECAELLSTLYRVAHSMNQRASCYRVYSVWRQQVYSLAAALNINRR